jgi:tetratricopeptide (TPR) repeat protein
VNAPREFGLPLLLLLLIACGSPRGEYERALERGGRELAGGDRARAAGVFLEAAQIATNSRDRDEALYRAASAYGRAERFDLARKLFDELSARPGDRRERASFDRARLEQQRGGPSADTLLLSALRAHPNSGLAPRALAEHLASVERRFGLEGALARTERLLPEFAASELDERVRYARARLLERAGDFARARAVYLDCAERHPYPGGALWDDALFAAARCEERLGQTRSAAATLTRLLAEREAARGLGSYERARYAQARFRLAELCRDALGDPARARREFRRVFDDHPTSLLGDDALFQEALVARRAGDVTGTCAPLQILRTKLPDSRFAACASELCPRVGNEGTRRCAPYILESLIGSEVPDATD